MNPKLITGLLVAFLILIFIFQNTTVVEIKFLFWLISMSRSLLILLLVALGMVIGWSLKSYVDYKRKQTIRADRSD